ncbi:MAG: S26 family signal peptidase, partial [Odoribacter splanchnicus]
MRNLLQNKWFKFSIVLIVYLLWVLWVGSWWLLILVPVIFDVYISRRVHWAFWKKKGVKKQTKAVEWIDALIFAVVAATLIRIFIFEAYTIPTSSMEKSMLVGDYLFVSKVAYGPKLPNTPLAVPFTHHTLPFTQSTKAYSELIQWPYKRIAGTSEIKRTDIIVFNFPTGDTVIIGNENPDYYSQLRTNARNYQRAEQSQGVDMTFEEAKTKVRDLMKQRFEIISRPVDKRENYIKRGVGMPGDTLILREGQLYV